MAGIWATRGRSCLERSPPQKIRASKSIVIELLERAIGGGEREREAAYSSMVCGLFLAKTLVPPKNSEQLQAMARRGT